MTYVHGQSKAAQQAKEAEDRVRAKAAALGALEAELDHRIQAREDMMRYIKPVPTYKPTPAAAAAWARFQANNHNPEPDEVGWLRLQAAAREMYPNDRKKAA